MTPVRQELPPRSGASIRKSPRSAVTPPRATGATPAPSGDASKTAVGAGDSVTAGRKTRKPGETRRARKEQTALSSTKVAQVRLQPDEVAALDMVVRRLNLASTSEALREGLRLLVREAAEAEAAEGIRAFYDGRQVPLPDGVTPATEAELKAADEAQW